MKEKFKYYQIASIYFRIEKINEEHYELTVHITGKSDEFFFYNFTGETAFAEVMEEILSYAEIDNQDWEEA